MIETVQERLVQPPRLDRFCPGEHCARACDASSCTCKPCHCSDCIARTVRARRGRLSGTQVQTAEAHPRLFPSPSSRSQS